MLLRWYVLLRDLPNTMLCCGRGVEDEVSMAEGPGRLTTTGADRHTTTATRSSSSRHTTTRRSQSLESRPYSQNVRTGSRHCETTTADAEAALRRTGNNNNARVIHSRNGATTTTTTTQNTPCGGGGRTNRGGPEMGIKTIEMENSSLIQTVEIFKQPGETLGFYIREGNGIDRGDGVFISRIQLGTVAERNGLLHVGDEIIAVNGVEVGKMSLDDVVILMSIPRKLMLKICSVKNCYKKNASCPSLAMTEQGSSPPVVVMKKGHVRANSDTQLEMTEKIPDMYDHAYSTSAPHTDIDYLGKRFSRGSERPTSSQYASIFITPHRAEAKLLTGEETNDSEHSSEGSLPRSIDSGGGGRDHYAGHRGYTSSLGLHEDPLIGPHQVPSALSPFPPSDSMEREYRYLQSERKFVPTHQRSPSKGSSIQTYHGTTGAHKPPSYYSASDSDRGAYSDPYQTIQDAIGLRGYTESMRRYQGGFREMIHSRAKYGGGKTQARSRSPECYNSDSEVIYTHPRGGGGGVGQVAVDPRGFASDYETYAGALGNDDDPIYAVPKIASSSSTELQQLLRRFNTLSHELQQEQTKLQKQLTTRDKPGTGYSHPEGYCSDEYGTIYSPPSASSHITKSLSPVPARKVTSATQTPSHVKLIRKHSADCLMSYKTYQMEEPYGGSIGSYDQVTNQYNQVTQEPRYSNLPPHMHSSSKVAQRTSAPPSTTPSQQTATTSGSACNVDPNKAIDTNGKTITRTSANRFRDLQLARRPLQIPYGEFDCYKADMRMRGATYDCVSGHDGMLSVHVLCGQGLKSTKMTLRDLYCVISVDSLNKARTMIRTGAVNFDWDEAFDIDLENAKDVSFLIYNWDPNFKHRLCFHGSIMLPGFVEPGRKKNVALKMEPKGLLYLTLVFKEPKLILQRSPQHRKDGLFGVDLDTVIKREGTRFHVPLLVVKCVTEVERRGADVVGIYRLCGSARRKAQLREVFEKCPDTVDLSPENVSDIHVITGVLKDYLRELPEPLVTNALYQMLLDALSVRLPSDPDGSAKLMLSILECLPKANQETMSLVLNHLHKISRNSEKNKMPLDQLAVCLGPVLLCPSALSSENATLQFQKHIEVLRYLLEIWPERNIKSRQTSGTISPKSDNSQGNTT